MSDQQDYHGESDGLLDALLRAHAAKLHHVIRDALKVESGLANLRPLRESAHQAGENAGNGELVVGRAEPAGGTDTAGEGSAVGQLVSALRHEKRRVAGLRERFEAIGPATFGGSGYRRVSGRLRSYGSYLGGLADGFGSQTVMDRDTVLQSLNTHREHLEAIRKQFAAAASGTDQPTQREWRLLVLLLEERADMLLELHGVIEWIFENSGSRQEVDF